MNASADSPAARSFVDTNVFVYSADDTDPVRQARARQLVTSLMSADQLCTSAQVMGEFFVTVTRKIRFPIPPAKALEALRGIASFSVVAIDYQLVGQACELSASARISYWDALIVVAASRAGATRLYTEDLNAGQILLGVEVVNPFAE